MKYQNDEKLRKSNSTRSLQNCMKRSLLYSTKARGKKTKNEKNEEDSEDV